MLQTAFKFSHHNFLPSFLLRHRHFCARFFCEKITLIFI
ncbi:hypothetical protein TERTU_4605 [Teredinibacter turnerae T7901]|uniref:Uncharacterized protein n=1 Tax=Teredinibacter turnerae (strain ATCC 39867 / T7901) TaxID=377629 RepID=C5BJW1_TERTT|nr:hypothetical protein TERTU_4605 [Teredinibacter turnerae T7901]